MEMKNDSDTSDLVDPLVDKSPLSLFHRTFKSSLSSTFSTNLPSPNSSSFNDSGSHLNARVLSSPELLKQTKTILEEAVFAEKEKLPRERRPALGLKRGKFSAKPIPSQPAVNLDFTIDVDNLSDPEEFFAAFERMENAKKEVQRLRGEQPVGLDLNQASLVPRLRRPSLLGRSAYRHRSYPSVSAADVNETLSPSQETFDIGSPTRNDVLPDANDTIKSPSVKVPESKSTTTSFVSELDELLAFNFEELDEDEVQNFLRDKLHIKSVDVGKANLPDWSVQLRESWTKNSAMRKKNDEVFHLSGKSNAIRIQDKVSPKKSNSPLASFSLLNRYIAKCRPSRDPYSPQRIDSSPATREPEKKVDQAGKSVEIDAWKNLREFSRSSAHEEEDITVSNEVPLVSATKNVRPNSEPKAKEDVAGQFGEISNRMGSCDFGSSPVHVENNVVSGEALASDVVAPTSEPERPEDEQVDATQLPVQLNFKGIDWGNCSSSGVEKGWTGEPSNTENVSVEEPLKEETVGSPKNRLREKEKSKASSESVISKETVKKGWQAKRSQSEVPASGEAKSKRRKGEGAQPGLSMGDKKLRRTSLYCAGTKWDAGVRRSTRIRMRPLEYWRGERFLYGRVHESLVTVIGVKYDSPSMDAEPGVKVKSFVPDKYKDLVEFASLH